MGYGGLSLLYLTGCSLPGSPPTPPITIPFALHQAGSVLETEVEIEQDDRVTLQLRFFVNDQFGNRDKLLALVGSFDQPGSPIPLNLKIIKHTANKDEVILNKIYMTIGFISLGKAEINRLIDELSIESGKYQIRVETIKPFPQLSETKVQFGLYYIRPPKF